MNWERETPLKSIEQIQAELNPYDKYRDTLLYAAEQIGGVDCKRHVHEMIYSDGYTTEDAIVYMQETYRDTNVMEVVQAIYDRLTNPPEAMPRRKQVALRAGKTALTGIRHIHKQLQRTPQLIKTYSLAKQNAENSFLK